MPDLAIVGGVVIVAGVLVVLSIMARYQTITVYEFQRGLRYRNETPALYQLRLLQQLESNSGNTFVLGAPNGFTPLPSARQRPASTADTTET